MAQTNQAWDWGVELRDEERPELERRGTVAELRKQLDQAHDSLRMSRRRERDATEAPSELDERRLWQRCWIRTALRNASRSNRYLTGVAAGLNESANSPRP
jgi:hypothetical protein